jgi:DNA-binding NtrC family response regulator
MNFPGYGGCINEPDTNRLPVLSVLYVDDEPVLLNVCKIFLERRPDISVSVASSVENALKLIETTSYDVIVSDYQMPGTDGIGFLKILREKQCPVPFILFTGRGREEIMTDAIGSGAMFYIQKNGNPRSRFNELENTIREACVRSPAESPLREKRLQYNTAF